MKKCPFCGADIEDSAQFCLYCMQSLTEKEQILLRKKKKPQWSLIIAAIGVSLLGVFLAFLLLRSGNQVAPEDRIPSESQGHTSAPSAEPTEAETSPSDPSMPETQPPTQAATQPVPEPHLHSYTVKNTSNRYYLRADAGCTYPAAYYYSCSCGARGSDLFYWGPVKGHTIVTDPGYPADCVNTGLTGGEHCSVCDTVLLSQTQIPVTDHTFDNELDESCNVCGYIRVIHCNHAETVTLPALSPTCTAGGLAEGKKCTLCQEILTAQIPLAPLGHAEVTDQAISPTCTTNGLTEGKHCATCNAIIVAQTAVIAKGHTEVIDPAVAATCTSSGLTEGKHCSICQIVLVYQQHVPARGHSFDPENPAAPCSLCGLLPHVHNFTEQNTAARYLKKAADCTTAARYYYSCTCGEKGDEYFFYGSATGHTVVTEPGYPPGCVTEGLTDRVYCSVCNDGFECHTPIPATGHAFSVGSSPSVCLDCGEYTTLTINAPELPLVVNSFGFEKPFRIDRITYSLKPMTDGKFYIEFTFYGTNISSESARFDFSASLYGPNNTALSCSLCRNLAPGESGTYLAAAQIKDPNGTYTLVFN